MEWNVLNYDFNKRKIVDYNIFDNWKFAKSVNELRDTYITFQDFVDKLDKEAKYTFWSRREYEISVGDAFDECLDRYEKIDVYRQIHMNINNLAQYIINCWNTISFPKKLICNDDNIWKVLNEVFDIYSGVDFEQFATDKYGELENKGTIGYCLEEIEYFVKYHCTTDYIIIDDCYSVDIL